MFQKIKDIFDRIRPDELAQRSVRKGIVSTIKGAAIFAVVFLVIGVCISYPIIPAVVVGSIVCILLFMVLWLAIVPAKKKENNEH